MGDVKHGIREWETTTPPGHMVRVEHDFWSGRTIIYLDGEQIFERGRKFWDTGLEHRFTIDGVPCIIRIMNRLFDYTYELWADGKLQ